MAGGWKSGMSLGMDPVHAGPWSRDAPSFWRSCSEGGPRLVSTMQSVPYPGPPEAQICVHHAKCVFTQVLQPALTLSHLTKDLHLVPQFLFGLHTELSLS